MVSFFFGLGKMKIFWISNLVTIEMTECKNLSEPRWENYLLISFSGRTKQIFFLVIKLEPWLLPWLQPRKTNCVPTEMDVTTSAFVLFVSSDWQDSKFWYVKLLADHPLLILVVPPLLDPLLVDPPFKRVINNILQLGESFP